MRNVRCMKPGSSINKHRRCRVKTAYFVLLLSFLFVTLWNCAPLPEASRKSGISEIYGVVSDRGSGTPISGVRVDLEGKSVVTFSDTQGLYSIRNLPGGSYTLRFSLDGYRTLKMKDVQIGRGEHYRLNVALLKKTELAKKKTTSSEKTYQAQTQSYRKKGKEPAPAKPEPPPESIAELPFEKVITHRQHSAPLRAAAHNDNEEYPFYLDYLNRYRDIQDVYRQDFRDRFIIRVVDGQGKPCFHYPFAIEDAAGQQLWQAVTYTNGENVIFPHIMFHEFSGDKLFVRLEKGGKPTRLPVKTDFDRITTIDLRSAPAEENLSLDLLFILDTTGSMGDEIQQLKDNLYSIYTRIKNYFSTLPIRFGLILYRDRGDDYVVKRFQFTGSIDEFQRLIDDIKSRGGGDTPEDIQAALEAALHQMDWQPEAAKLAFLIADAPPHLDYDEKFTYPDAALEANARGIKCYTIGASGLDVAGEYVFRQLSAITYSEFIFLTYGESGESEGRGVGKVSHHTGDNYESHNLDDLLVNIVKKEMAYQLPAELVRRRAPDPKIQERYLKTRLDNLWSQVAKQLNEFLPEQPVAVLAPIEASEAELDGLAKYLQQMSVVSILEAHKMKLVERERLKELLEEKGLSLAGLIRDENFEELYTLLGSNVIFLGEVSYAGVDRVIFMRAVKTDNSRIIAAARIRL